MKTRILYSITALLIFTFAFVVYASLGSNSSVVVASDDKCCTMKDCCKDGKCSMSKEKDGKCKCAEMHKNHAKKDGKCCDKADCCKDGKCSMSADGKCKCGGEHKCSADCCKDGKCKMSADGKCTCECCKDGKCEMHKKDGNHQSMKGGCCNGESCQMKKKDTPKDN